MSARHVSSTLIKNITAKTGKQVSLAYVDKTSTWSRPSEFPSENVKQDFAKVAEENVGTFKPGVVKIAMKESEHQSDRDKSVHYTAYGLDKDGKVIDVQHLRRSV